MLHGTSLESLLVMVNTGTLSHGCDFDDATKNYLYFANVEENFEGKRYSGLRGFNHSVTLEIAKSYAHVNAAHDYVGGLLVSAGIDPNWTDKIIYNFMSGCKYRIPREEQKKAKDLGEDWWDKIWIESKKCKGIVLEADECILERKLSPDPDDCGIRVFCPEGLHARYFKGARLLGKREKEIMRKYVGQQQACQLTLSFLV